jgi:hypothetical protein
MKKSVVMVIVALLGLVLFLQYRQKKAEPPPLPAGQATPMPEAQQQGVPLPAEASIPYTPPPAQETRPASPIRSSAKPVFTPPAQMAGSGPLPLINADFARTPIGYTGKSLNEILSSHGKVWGGATFGADAFTPDENHSLYGVMAQFFSCMAVAYGDLNMCNYLPGALTKKDRYFGSPHYACIDPSDRTLFFAYAAGRFEMAKGEEACRRYLAGDAVEGARVPPEFCREVSKGFAYICDMAPPRDRSRCREAFPAESANCRTQSCTENNRLYLSLRDANIGACPEKYMTECGVFSTKSPSVCMVLLDKIAGVYSQTVMTHDQNASPEKKKRQEEERKKEEQKIIEDINKKARQALGKE